MKKEAKIEDQIKQHFKILMYIWEHDRKYSLLVSKKITEEERSHVVGFLFWLQGQGCRIQEPDRFKAKIAYNEYCWAIIEEAKKKLLKKGKQ